MKSLDITLHFETEEERINFIKGLNNAVIAYSDIWFSIFMGIEVPTKWKPYYDMENFVGADLIKEQLDSLIKQLKSIN